MPSSDIGVDPWWYELVRTALQNPVLDNSRSIFTNRSLRFDKIKAVGFDFDHTLGLYNADFDQLAMDLVIERLIHDEGYHPDYFKEIPDLAFAQKGLIVDIGEGNLCKIDRFGHVVNAYHGINRLTHNERREMYGDKDCIPHVTEGRRFTQLDSAFAMPETLLFTAIAPHVKQCESDFQSLWYKLRTTTDCIHRDGTLKKLITKDPEAYINPDFDILNMLATLRESGKTVFLLTNSEWEYVDVMLEPALGIARESHSGSWTDLFDVVVCEAAKPKFFRSDNHTHASRVDQHANVFRSGNIAELETELGCGKLDVLYVGDHIHSDLITSKQNTYWRTMLVIPELKEEIEILSGLPGMAYQIKQADDRRMLTELEVRHWASTDAALSRCPDAGEASALIQQLRAACNEQRNRAKTTLHAYVKQRETLHKRLSEAMNPYWGSLFRAGAELTYYAKQLDNFACTYTSQASNLALYPTTHYFRSAMDYLPHEVQSM